MLRNKVGDLIPHQTIPGTERLSDEDEDLCKRMEKLSTSTGDQDQVKLWRQRTDTHPREWQVGDICVCRCCEDNKWYFAKIIDITEETGYCDVQFLYYDDEQYFIRLDCIHRVDASSWKWVEDEDNAFVAQELLNTGGMKSPLSFREPQASSSVANPEEKRAARLRNPNVGDICVCQWGGDAYFYFVKIVAMDITEQIYKVKLLHRRRHECYVPFENIYPYYSTEANMVTYGRNVKRMRREIRKQMSLPEAVPELGVQSGKPDMKNRKGQSKMGSRGDEWSGGLVLSRFWRTLLLETFGNDEKVIRNLLNSWYMCGYQTGYAMAHKIGRSEGA